MYDGNYPDNFQITIQLLFSFQSDTCCQCSSKKLVRCSREDHVIDFSSLPLIKDASV